MAVALPGDRGLAVVRQSRVVLLGLHIAPVGDVQTAYLLWILALLAFVAGEELSSYQTDRTSDSHATRGPQLTALHYRATFVALLVFGALVTIFATATGQAQTISSRGTVLVQGSEIVLW